MAVDIVVTQLGFAAGTPRALFAGRYEVAPVPSTDYDVSLDGQRFLMIKPSEQAQAAPTDRYKVNGLVRRITLSLP